MNNKALRGLALILFGILFCAGDAEINRTVLYSFGEISFSAIGFLIGAVGLGMVFRSTKEPDGNKDQSDSGKDQPGL